MSGCWEAGDCQDPGPERLSERRAGAWVVRARSAGLLGRKGVRICPEAEGSLGWVGRGQWGYWSCI